MLGMLLAAMVSTQAPIDENSVAPNPPLEQQMRDAERRLEEASWPIQVRFFLAESADQEEFDGRVDFVALRIRFVASCLEWLNFNELRISNALRTEQYPEFLRELLEWAIEEGQRDPLPHHQCQRILTDLNDGTYQP